MSHTPSPNALYEIRNCVSTAEWNSKWRPFRQDLSVINEYWMLDFFTGCEPSM